jgi:hypothetical protein
MLIVSYAKRKLTKEDFNTADDVPEKIRAQVQEILND